MMRTIHTLIIGLLVLSGCTSHGGAPGATATLEEIDSARKVEITRGTLPLLTGRWGGTITDRRNAIVFRSDYEIVADASRDRIYWARYDYGNRIYRRPRFGMNRSDVIDGVIVGGTPSVLYEKDGLYFLLSVVSRARFAYREAPPEVNRRLALYERTQACRQEAIERGENLVGLNCSEPPEVQR